jgi:hypothetical protein
MALSLETFFDSFGEDEIHRRFTSHILGFVHDPALNEFSFLSIPAVDDQFGFVE